MTDQLSNSSWSFITMVPALSTTAKTMARHMDILTAWVMSANAFRVWVNSMSISMSSSPLSEGSFSRQSRTASLRVKEPMDSARSSSSLSTTDSWRPERSTSSCADWRECLEESVHHVNRTK